MIDAVHYILKEQTKMENALNAMRRAVRKQKRFDNVMWIAVVALSVRMTFAEMELRGQNQKMKELEKQIEEIKYSEGE